MIRLTLLNGEHWYVNPDYIVRIKSGHKYGAAIEVESDHQTGIEHAVDEIQVQESPEEVVRKVLEWKLAMIDYHHDTLSIKTKAMSKLVRLAGLKYLETGYGNYCKCSLYAE